VKVIAIKNVERKGVPIYYRLVYTGVAEIEIANDTKDYRVEFIIEIMPTGESKVSVSMQDDIHYPLLPVMGMLKEVIGKMHSNGEFPVTN